MTLCSDAGGAATAARIPQFAFEKYKLGNGLEVILHEDHSTPIVGVNVWYHVGSKNERPGRTGFAHLFEHMMFQGSKHYDQDYFRPLEQVGGRVNGSTNTDRTNYWETVPANCLELALWMESDRMGFLLPAMTQPKLDNQRDVVKNERRQRNENRPYGLTHEVILAALFPPDHPYSWPVIGSMADLDQARLQDVADFFRHYYHPGNASLCIAGDFQPADARRLVEKYFGRLPTGPRVEKMRPRSIELREEKRFQMTDRVGLPRVYLAWPSPSLFGPDEAAAILLSDILTGGKTSRLDRALVRQRQIAQDVEAWQDGGELGGTFFVIATGRSETKSAELLQAMGEEIARLGESGPTPEELTRAVTRLEVQRIRGLEAISGFGGRADRLNYYNVFTGDPANLSRDFQRFLAVTPGDIARVARQYLGKGRVVLEVLPGKERKIFSDPRGPAEEQRQKMRGTEAVSPLAAEKLPAEAAWAALPRPGASPRFMPAAIRRLRLQCGMELLVAENHELPTVSMSLLLRGGRSADPVDRPGVGSLLAAVWDEGTASRSAEEIADQLALRGASLSVGCDWDWINLRLGSLTRQLPEVLEVFADVLRNPTFPAPEIEREKKKALGQLRQIRAEAGTVATLAMGETLYGVNHPYGRPSRGTPKSIAAIDRAALEADYRLHLRPAEATLIAAGDVQPEALARQLDKVFAGWKVDSAGALPALPALPPPQPTHVVLLDKPGAAQSVVIVGQIGLARNDPDYYPLSVMDALLGGQFSSRLNMNLREAKGYTYGARSFFDWRHRQPGPFLAMSNVHTEVTAKAVTEFLEELKGVGSRRPPTAAETEFAKDWLTRAYPAEFETPRQFVWQLESLVGFGLPDDFFRTYIPRIQAVEADQIVAATRRHLDIDHLAVVVVGDRRKIESDLRSLPIGKRLEVRRFDEEFRLVPAGTERE